MLFVDVLTLPLAEHDTGALPFACAELTKDIAPTMGKASATLAIANRRTGFPCRRCRSHHSDCPH
jgi:hypothetical protein